jgi:hypothetical protein
MNMGVLQDIVGGVLNGQARPGGGGGSPDLLQLVLGMLANNGQHA